jgi:hypothetical protein
LQVLQASSCSRYMCGRNVTHSHSEERSPLFACARFTTQPCKTHCHQLALPPAPTPGCDAFWYTLRTRRGRKKPSRRSHPPRLRSSYLLKLCIAMYMEVATLRRYSRIHAQFWQVRNATHVLSQNVGAAGQNISCNYGCAGKFYSLL